MKEYSKYHKIHLLLKQFVVLGKKYKLKNQRNNKQKILNIKGGTLKKFVLRSLLKSQQSEQGFEGKTHTNVCSKK